MPSYHATPQTTILAIDASTERCSAALSSNGNIFSQTCDTPRSHAKVILPMVDSLLAEAGITVADISGLAVSLGPGSFTGIRIGIGVIQGLSFGASLPIYGFSSLEILAWQISQGFDCPNGATIIPCLDARMAEIYWAGYTYDFTGKNTNGEGSDNEVPVLIPCHEACVSAPEILTEALAKLDSKYCFGGGHGWLLNELCEQEIPGCDGALLPEAKTMLTLMANYQQRGEALKTYDAATIEPLYLRNEVTWEKRTRVRDKPL